MAIGRKGGEENYALPMSRHKKSILKDYFEVYLIPKGGN